MPESDDARRVRQSEARASSVPLDKPKLTWAVDDGQTMAAMSTFDLWHALAAGRVEPTVLVWRLGRECWTPAIEIPELACALRVSLHGAVDPAERRTLDYRKKLPSFGLRPAPGQAAGVQVEQAPSDPDLVVSDADLDAIELEAIQHEADLLFGDLDEADDEPRRFALDEQTPGPTVLESGAPPRVADEPAPKGEPKRRWFNLAGAAAMFLLLLGAPALTGPALADAGARDGRVALRDALVHAPVRAIELAASRSAKSPPTAAELPPPAVRHAEPSAVELPASEPSAKKPSAKKPSARNPSAKKPTPNAPLAKSYSPTRSGQKRASRTKAR